MKNIELQNILKAYHDDMPLWQSGNMFMLPTDRAGESRRPAQGKNITAPVFIEVDPAPKRKKDWGKVIRRYWPYLLLTLLNLIVALLTIFNK